MAENYDVTVDNEVEAIDTDLVPVDSGESEGGIGAGEVALGALAVVGAGFLLKKTYDGGKWICGKAKAGIQSLKDKRAEKKAAKDQDNEAQEAEPEVVEAEVVTDESK